MALKRPVIENFNENKIKKSPAVQYHLRNFMYTFVLLQSFSMSTGINAHVELLVNGIGFHRNFTYHVKLNNFTEENCQVSLYHELPSAFYANINELANRRRVEKIKVCSTGETDVESFMENAQSQNVTLCTHLTNGSCIMTLQIHQRYWYPKEDGDYQNIILKKPHLLIGCERRIKGYRVSKVDLCPLCATLALKWRDVPYVIDVTNYAWTIPIGNIYFLPLVTFITLSTTLIGTIILMKTIWVASSKNSQKND